VVAVGIARPPHFFEQVPVGHHIARIGHQNAQQSVFNGCEVNHMSASADLTPYEINFDLSKLMQRLF
jgi:hypothetical protein